MPITRFDRFVRYLASIGAVSIINQRMTTSLNKGYEMK